MISSNPTQFSYLFQLQINILDINDQSPQFPIRKKRVPVLETANVGALFELPLAVDTDADNLGVQQYSLVEPTNTFELTWNRNLQELKPAAPTSTWSWKSKQLSIYFGGCRWRYSQAFRYVGSFNFCEGCQWQSTTLWASSLFQNCAWRFAYKICYHEGECKRCRQRTQCEAGLFFEVQRHRLRKANI